MSELTTILDDIDAIPHESVSEILKRHYDVAYNVASQAWCQFVNGEITEYTYREKLDILGYKPRRGA